MFAPFVKKTLLPQKKLRSFIEVIGSMAVMIVLHYQLAAQLFQIFKKKIIKLCLLMKRKL